MHPESLDMLDTRNPLHQPSEFVIVQGKRVASAKDYLAERKISLDGLENLRPTGEPGRSLGVRKVPAETEPAMDATLANRYHKKPALVFLQPACGRCGPCLAEGVAGEPRVLGLLKFLGQNLQEEGVQGVAPADSRQIRAWDQ